MDLRLAQVLLLLWVFAGSPALARQSVEDLFKDFKNRLEEAVGTRDAGAVMTLYQTNGMRAAEFAGEVAWWKSALADDAQGKLSIWLKELATLPSEQARNFWSEYAQHLTSNQVTHIVWVGFERGSPFALPLVSAEGKLWIVPSEKKPWRSKTAGPANRSQPLTPQTNGPPAATSPGPVK